MSGPTAIEPAHLLGIGGRGMGSLARAMLDLGMRVSGSDKAEGPRIGPLRAAGARITIGHDAANLGDAAAVITNAAIRPDNPELLAARERGIPVLHRAQAIDVLMRARRGIAVAGTHGKTTTASMIALILERAGLDPTYVIGGDRYEGGSNGRGGAGEWMVAEADESDAALLHLSPEIAVITNIDAEHLDFYRDLAHIQDTFIAFTERVAGDGVVIASATDPGMRAVLGRIRRRLVRFAMDEGDWTAEREVVRAGQRLLVRRGGEPAGEVTLRVPGAHNAINALGALAAAAEAGVDFAAAATALAGYRGVPRRFDLRGRAREVTVVDDHAHNPAEIAAALATAREQRPGRVFAVFQPHLFSRTQHLYRELAGSLTAADLVVVTAIDGAREDPIPGITGELVVDALREADAGADVTYVPVREEVAPSVAALARPGDLVVTLGCGDVTLLVEPILAALEERA